MSQSLFDHSLLTYLNERMSNNSECVWFLAHVPCFTVIKKPNTHTHMHGTKTSCPTDVQISFSLSLDIFQSDYEKQT